MKRLLAALVIVALSSASACKRAVVQASNKIMAEALDREMPAGPRQIRATGTVQAVRASSIQVPQITGQSVPSAQNGRVTLVRLITNGTHVKKGDLLAEFDRTQQTDAARDAQAKYEDLAQQVKQKDAENLSKAEKRTSELKQAEADLAKARIELRKGPILSEIDRIKNEAKAGSAEARVESLNQIDKDRRIAEAAALKVLELQMTRQKVALERANRNAEKLELHAPLAGMVALENIWKQGSMGHAQEGDQLFPGQPLMKIFDPAEMEIRALVGEPDGAALQPGTTATVYLDAYPDAVFQARFHSASPVATSAIGSPDQELHCALPVGAGGSAPAAGSVRGNHHQTHKHGDAGQNSGRPMNRKVAWMVTVAALMAVAAGRHFFHSIAHRPGRGHIADSARPQRRFSGFRTIPGRVESAPIRADRRSGERSRNCGSSGWHPRVRQ